jgi:SAM-dependent methyltransferase
VRKHNRVCENCKKEIKHEAFCEYCRYPTGVFKPYDIDNSELNNSILDLLSVMRGVPFLHSNNSELDNIFHELVSLYWLRPESALFRYIEAKILLNFMGKYITYPMLDLGCGEGLFTSILFGARINTKYDNYESVDFSKNDPYNCYNGIPNDFFSTRPSPIGTGIDNKKTSIQKAIDLGIYDAVDIGDIRFLPYEGNCFSSAYSNMINDVCDDDLHKTFSGVHRVLKDDGFFIFTTPNQNFLELMYYYNKCNNGAGKFDKGRSQWKPRAESVWNNLANDIGFEIVSCIEYGDRNLISFWDTGFRPLFKKLIEFRKYIKEDSILEVKQIWIEILKTYLHQFSDLGDNKGGFSVIVMRKI